MAQSMDGVNWSALPDSPFSVACYSIVWNGTLWVAVGEGDLHTIAYSYNGLSWTGIGKDIFSTKGTQVHWNGTLFLATGVGTNPLAYSYDGHHWVGLSPAAWDGGNAWCLFWDGRTWMAGGNGTTHVLASSLDGITWVGKGGTSTFDAIRALLWTGAVWVAGGDKTDAGVLAYSTDQGASWVEVVCPIAKTVTGLAQNRTTLIAVGQLTTLHSGHSMAYCSSLYGDAWTGTGHSILDSTTVPASVTWVDNTFVVFGAGGSNRIARSRNGIQWIPARNVSSIFGDAAYGGHYSSALAHSLVFPANQCIAGNQISFDNGRTWTYTRNDMTGNMNVAWNGQYFLVLDKEGGPSYRTSSLFSSDAYIPISFEATPPTAIHRVRSNGVQWLMGTTSATDQHVLISEDGLTWRSTDVHEYADSGYPCMGIAWNGRVWIVSGQANGTEYIAYSENGTTWAQSGVGIGGGPVEWNGFMFICGGMEVAGETILYKSANGIQWTTQSVGAYGQIVGIACHSDTWVLVTDLQNSPAILTSSDGIQWSAVGGSQSYTYRDVVWTGQTFVTNTDTSLIRYSYNGTDWVDVSVSEPAGFQMAWTNPSVGTMTIHSPVFVGGVAANGGTGALGMSMDGIQYTRVAEGLFSSCRAIHWNGIVWVAGGTGSEHTMAYSYDGIHWTGMGKSVFSTACHAMDWNGHGWVAMGEGTHTIATSSNGIHWIGRGNSVFTGAGHTIHWNGHVWMAGGEGTNTMAVQSNLLATGEWTILASSPFTTRCRQVVWVGNKWISVGSGTHCVAYNASIDGSGMWTGDEGDVFGTEGYSIAWNGKQMVIGGSDDTHTIYTSSDGTLWTGQGTPFASTCRAVFWADPKWIAVGENIQYS